MPLDVTGNCTLSRLSFFVLAVTIAACNSPATPTAPTTAAASPARLSSDISATETFAAFTAEPSPVRGGDTTRGTISLPSPAPAGGTVITLTSSDRDVRPPASITVPEGQTTAMFLIHTSEPHADTLVRITATGGGVTQTLELMLLLNPPGAHADSYTMSPGGTLTVPGPGILDNDVRRSGHDLTAVLVLGPVSGTLTLRDDGGFTYRPNAGFDGMDRFIYRAMDGAKSSNAQHVWIRVGGGAFVVPTGSQTFNVTGTLQTFTVPIGVAAVTIEAWGGSGGNGRAGINGTQGVGGLGGFVQATIEVSGGDVLTIAVGSAGLSGGRGNLGGTNGGVVGLGGSGHLLFTPVGSGGGGAASVITSAGKVMLITGGGGGGGFAFNIGEVGGNGGGGGGRNGASGANGTVAGGGGGGTAAGAGGAGGTGEFAGATGAPGAAAPSGNGGSFIVVAAVRGGGGGGGGYGGGGAGGGSDGAAPFGNGGGGGGSSYTDPAATNVMHQQGVRSGHGLVIIRW